MLPTLYNMLLILFWLSYLALWLILRLRSVHTDTDPGQLHTPHISILIPVRNEINHLHGLLASLDALRYPSEQIQILFADDASTDGSTACLEHYCRSRTSANVSIFETAAGKAGALARLAQKAQGDIFFFTDGDCTVPPQWIQSHLQRYQDAAVGMVGGAVVARAERSLLSRLQTIDWLRFSAVGWIAAQNGLPLSVFGNHFSMRREAYAAAGGFETAAHSVTEDYALMAAMLEQSDWKLGFLDLQQDNLVMTQAESGWSNFFRQRKRWAAGARDRSFFSSFLTGLNLIALPLFLFLYVMHFKLTACASLGIYLCMETMLTRHWQRLAGLKGLRPPSMLHPFFFTLYAWVLIPAYLFSRKMNWKDRTITVR